MPKAEGEMKEEKGKGDKGCGEALLLDGLSYDW